jgi:hypothetical protein
MAGRFWRWRASGLSEGSERGNIGDDALGQWDGRAPRSCAYPLAIAASWYKQVSSRFVRTAVDLGGFP